LRITITLYFCEGQAAFAVHDVATTIELGLLELVHGFWLGNVFISLIPGRWPHSSRPPDVSIYVKAGGLSFNQ
jgi:hypothetical protein